MKINCCLNSDSSVRNVDKLYCLMCLGRWSLWQQDVSVGTAIDIMPELRGTVTLSSQKIQKVQKYFLRTIRTE